MEVKEVLEKVKAGEMSVGGGIFSQTAFGGIRLCETGHPQKAKVRFCRGCFLQRKSG